MSESSTGLWKAIGNCNSETENLEVDADPSTSYRMGISMAGSQSGGVIIVHR